MKLEWRDTQWGPEALLGDFAGDDGVRFSLMHMPTCHRRGPWRLLVEVADARREWGCFDEQDQPMRWYHSEQRAREEAQAIADVLVADHEGKTLARATVRIERGTPEWTYAWDALMAKTGDPDPSGRCPDCGEEWVYMATEVPVGSGQEAVSGSLHHVFRHRHHPKTQGRRYEFIPVREMVKR